MGRYLRLEDIKLKPKIISSHPQKVLRYFCDKCDRYHWIYSDIGNKHRDYKA